MTEELREKLKVKYKKLEDGVKRFNELHREAKYLKKELVVIRSQINELERQINNHAH